MVSTASNVTYFDERVYRDLNKRVKKYYMESDLLTQLPIATTKLPRAKEYKKGIFDYVKGYEGGNDLSRPDNAVVPKDTRTYEIGSVKFAIEYTPEEMALEADILGQKKDAILAGGVRQVALSAMKGLYPHGFGSDGYGNGTQLHSGILDQATSVIDLNGTDSLLNAAGDVYAALVKMVDSIPFRYRAGRTIVLGMTGGFFGNANGDTFTNDNGYTEWDRFYERYITKGVKGFNVSPTVIVSDDLFLDSTDTLGTNDRLFAMIADNDLIEIAFSQGLMRMNERIGLMGGVEQGWAAMLRGCVHDANAVQYSEQITW